MTALTLIDDIKALAALQLDQSKRASLGQFFTDAPIAAYMASLFESIQGEVKLLDPGCGPCSLIGSFTDEAIRRGELNSIAISAWDLEEKLKPFIDQSLKICSEEFQKKNIDFKSEFNLGDFLLSNSASSDSHLGEQYTHTILNPPYKKISSASLHKKVMKDLDLDYANLYSAFVSLAIKKLKPMGELVAIIPRSFCNGPYYKRFREIIINECSIKKIHLFDSRKSSFKEDKVLQENIIIHLIKGQPQQTIQISSSPMSEFYFDEVSSTVVVNDMTIRYVEFSDVVSPSDNNQFISIAANESDRLVVEQINKFGSKYEDLPFTISTGPVVGFRLREHLRENLEVDSAGLIHSQNLKKEIEWPLKNTKPSAIDVNSKTLPWLWKNKGAFILVKRFSSKEEPRRIVATIYDSSIRSDLIGFDNKLNVFHINKEGFDLELAKGIYIYLNSTILDKYYRIFGGHTQVNATDLKTIPYPDESTLRTIGNSFSSNMLDQQEIDGIINRELQTKLKGFFMSPDAIQIKIDTAIEILKTLGLPSEQQNDRSGLTLLALLNLKPNQSWSEVQRPMIGVTPIIEWCREFYGKSYAPNTRETIRRQTLHQFREAGLIEYNPDDPGRAVNSPKTCYQIANEIYSVIKLYESSQWGENLGLWLGQRQTLIDVYAMQRNLRKVPVTIHNGQRLELSPGKHSQLISDIVVEFASRFAHDSKVLYLGDTGTQEDIFDLNDFNKLGVQLDARSKLPDVVLYRESKNWLYLIESVTSHGPVDSKRHLELNKIFEGCSAGLVFVSAFPDKSTMNKFISAVSWETEIWVADAPDHLIHLNGDRFLGPH